MSRMCPALSLVPGITVHLLVEPAAAVLAARSSSAGATGSIDTVGSAQAQAAGGRRLTPIPILVV